MTFVVTKKCIDCKDMACASVCPCDCFHESPDMLFIDPNACIDCGACQPECPVEAIYPEEDVPKQYQSDIKMNAKMVEIFPAIFR